MGLGIYVPNFLNKFGKESRISNRGSFGWNFGCVDVWRNVLLKSENVHSLKNQRSIKHWWRFRCYYWSLWCHSNCWYHLRFTVADIHVLNKSVFCQLLSKTVCVHTSNFLSSNFNSSSSFWRSKSKTISSLSSTLIALFINIDSRSLWAASPDTTKAEAAISMWYSN